jgi:hypothetical protein
VPNEVIRFKVKKGRLSKDNRAIITLSLQKAGRVINLYRKYKEIGFTDFSLVDLAEMSMSQWRRREFPIPKGYRLNWVKILVKLKPRDLIHS